MSAHNIEYKQSQTNQLGQELGLLFLRNISSSVKLQTQKVCMYVFFFFYRTEKNMLLTNKVVCIDLEDHFSHFFLVLILAYHLHF